MNALEDFLVSGVLAFMLVFMRMGTAVMIMPGLGDSFVPQKIRLHMALGLSLVLFPLVIGKVPAPMPGPAMLLPLIGMEFIVGLFIGTIARIFMTAMDTAGMIISFSSSLSNAQLFNPSLASQGSLMGAFLSVTGVVFLFATNLHHLLIMGVVESYELFPIGVLPDSGSMADLMARAVASSFLIGIEISAPFIILTTLIYVGMGVLSRLMPQVQVFMIALPLQIVLSLILMTMTLSVGLLYWAHEFEDSMVYFLGGG
ncbi:MAG: flagellar biosynthetic protein FliR [Alphaproteobacteria bacterium]|nr:flagellar biosynthetic protein FliR [Alphaproteobacteria bacterium]